MTRLFIAPAAHGKTRYLTELIFNNPNGAQVCVSTTLQAQAWRQRLAERGGALGVRIQTLDDFFADVLDAAGEAPVRLSEPAQYRLLQTIAADTPLTHFAAVREFPGFIHLLQNFIATVKSAGITPKQFLKTTHSPRLQEPGEIYARYQDYLRKNNWADTAELGLRAIAAAPKVTIPEKLLVIDGFDNFNAVQLAFLHAISAKFAQVIITLTGQTSGDERPLVHQRFEKTRRQIEKTFNITAEPLPNSSPPAAQVLAHLETELFAPREAAIPNENNTLTLLETADRPAEVRAALRWLKTRLVTDSVPADRMALLARNIGTYLPHIRQIGAEFGLPLRIFKTEPLSGNPLIAALLNLLRLSLPLSADTPERAFPHRLTVQAWRSPYFDWSAAVAGEPVGIGAGDAVVLDAIARYGTVLSGENQWRDTLARLAQRPQKPRGVDEELLAASLPTAAESAEFAAKFDRFARYLTPPAEAETFADFVRWLETLIGDDTLPADTSLRVMSRAAAEPATAERDISALRALKEVLRGLVWAEQAIAKKSAITFPEFFAELAGAIEATGYSPAGVPDTPAILVADAVAVRGLAFDSVAVLGMAEGEFPAVQKEDPLLRDADRRRLNTATGANLQLATDSDEVEFFYETITRPWAKLLLTRPRLADNGATWQPSPFWEEVRARLDVAPSQPPITPPAELAASWGELFAALGERTPPPWLAKLAGARVKRLEHAADLFTIRRVRDAKTPFDGDLSAINAAFSKKYTPEKPWSASRLEQFRACPFMFFAASVLKLEPRAEPSEGLDARQLGNIYHHIFEELYGNAPDPTDAAALLARLPEVAQSILDAAPAVEGFRETAWWAHTRSTIEENVRASVKTLADIAGNFTATHAEKGFFGADALTVRDGADEFRLHGIIDRVDQLPDGSIRVIDYKTASPYAFTDGALKQGKKLQLPLYALAARDALKLGTPSDGYYFHIQQAERSKLTLAKFKMDGGQGADIAIAVAVAHAWEAVRGARAGRFMPHPPVDGCPSYCPAAGFCWHYRPGFGG